MSDLIRRKDVAEFMFNNRMCTSINNAYDKLKCIPTAYDVDSVVEQLEEEKNLHKKMIEYEQKNGTVTEEFQARRAVEVLERAIEIVKGGGADG